MDIEGARKLHMNYPPGSEIRLLGSAKSPWSKLRLSNVREGFEVEINFDPKS